MEREYEPLAYAAATGNEYLTVLLVGGGVIQVPWEKLPAVKDAGVIERMYVEVIMHGRGISWPLLDEDLSVAGLYRDYGPREEPHEPGDGSTHTVRTELDPL